MPSFLSAVLWPDTSDPRVSQIMEGRMRVPLMGKDGEYRELYVGIDGMVMMSRIDLKNGSTPPSVPWGLGDEEYE